MGETMGEMGMTFVKLAKFETEQSKWESQTLCADLTRQFALTAVKVSRLQRTLNSQTVIYLVMEILSALNLEGPICCQEYCKQCPPFTNATR
jgi:hypothetical protein